MTQTALLTLIAAIAIPAIAQNQNPQNAATYGVNGNPATYYNNNGTLMYAPYNGYGAAPSMQQFGTYDPAADPFYNANAACNSPVMQQNGWTVTRQTSPTQCEWQKSKMSNPQYVEWLRRKQQQYAEMQQRADAVRSRTEAPAARIAQPPTYVPPTQVRTQPTAQQRLGTPSFIPVPNMPANALPNWFPNWQQYQNATNPRGGLNDLGRRGR
jgi:hypothetical protein